MNLKSKRAKLVTAVIAVTALAASPAIAELIGAGDIDGTPRVMLSGGSDTTYAMQVRLNTIYNEAPGCYQTILSGAATSNFGKCLAADGKTPVSAPALSDSIVNPQHDTMVELFPVGSGNGIKQLLDGGITPGVPALAFARSSRSLAAGNETKYLNSTAFAADGISWFHFTKVNNKATSHAALKTLTLAQLAAVYSGKTTTWNQLMPTDKVLGVMAAYTTTINGKVTTVRAGINNGNPETDLSKKYVTYRPLKVYFGQDGSGTASSWHSALKAGDATYAAAAQVNDDQGNCVNFCRIFENNATAIPSADGEKAIYFYSYGRYTQNNKELVANKVITTKEYPGYDAAKKTGGMVGNSTGRKLWADALGQIAGIDVNPDTVLAKTFPANRMVYLITKQNPAATVKNYVNFLCSATMDTATTASGLVIRPLIDAAIKAEGFIPLAKAIDGGLDNSPAQSYCRTTVATG